MKILSVSVQTFGKIKNTEISFGDGVNVVQNVNGFGKTTLANFIRAMLYGFTKTKSKNDPSRYAPWNSSEKFGGSMVVEHNGDTYRIERYFGKTAKQESVTVINLKTGKPLKTEEGIGEYFLGLTVDSYDRSTYFPQESVELSSNDNFDAKLANLVENGAENYEKIKKRLYDYKKNLKINRGNGGKIYDLQTRRQNLQRELSQSEQAERRHKEIETRLNEISLKKNEIADRQKINKKEITELQTKLAQAQPDEEEKQLRSRLLDLKEKLARTPNEFPQDVEECDGIEKEIRNLRGDIRPKLYPNFRILAVSIILIIAGIGLLIFTIPKWWGIMSGIILAVLGALGIYVAYKRRGAITLVAGEREALVTEYFNIASKYIDVSDLDYNGVKKELAKAYRDYLADLRVQEVLSSSLGNKTHDFDDLESKLVGLNEKDSEYSEQLLNLSQEQGRLTEESRFLKFDSVSIEDKILNTEDELKKAEFDYKIADTVDKLLDSAKDNLSVSYLPRLADRCGKLLNGVTEGRYEVIVDRNFSVSLRENGQTKPVAEFSRGIREITFLCFRLALSELLYDGSVPLIIIDDAFVNFDEENFARATELLRQSAKSSQVLYFTCHKRLGCLIKK